MNKHTILCENLLYYLVENHKRFRFFNPTTTKIKCKFSYFTANKMAARPGQNREKIRIYLHFNLFTVPSLSLLQTPS